MTARILLVDDNAALIDNLRDILEGPSSTPRSRPRSTARPRSRGRSITSSTSRSST